MIGLTGNLAMGKTVVRKMLEHLGVYTIDAGGLEHQAMAPGAPAYKPIIQAFGTWILDAEHRVVRSRMAAVAFSHPDALRRYQSIMQPVVGRAIDTLINRSTQKFVVVEAIDLLEGAFANAVDAIWVVNCSPENQLARLMKKEGISQWEARKRIDLQNPQQEKLARAAAVIENDGSADETWQAVQAAWRKLAGAAGVEAQRQQDQGMTQVIAMPAPAPDEPETAREVSEAEVTVKRGTPKNAEEIARLITELTGQQMTRTDLMMAFGEKSYMLADVNGTNVGLVGFQVENLITRVDEFMLVPKFAHPAVVRLMIDAVEQASTDLQSEIGFFFLPQDVPQPVRDAFGEKGYAARTLEQIKVPAWREAARESQPEGTIIFARKLRAERVLKPL
ncbi:MAG: dephospho-CoA kinase [Anaerolineae bacterium]|nr:dephospho-CoA kinase [Anaerolineae bacterium]